MSDKKTKNGGLLAGSTSEVQAGNSSSQSMKHGEESRGMLLALLNSPLETMINSQQAKVLATCLSRGSKATIIIFYETVPTANNTLESVGTDSVLYDGGGKA